MAALIAGATAAAKDTAGVAVKDAYEALKALIKKKFAEQGKDDPSTIIDKFEKKPEVTKPLLEDELKEAGIDQDEEIVKKAQDLMKQEDPEGFEAGKYNTTVNVQGDVIGVAGTNTGTINFGNITR